MLVADGRLGDFDAGEFIGEQVNFVNHDGEALDADALCLAFEGQV